MATRTQRKKAAPAPKRRKAKSAPSAAAPRSSAPALPVLFIHWRRPELVPESLPPVLASGAPALYVARGAPRPTDGAEVALASQAVTEAALKAAPAEFYRSAERQGYRETVTDAIGWALEREAERVGPDRAALIVVEDSVVCSAEFFRFAAGAVANGCDLVNARASEKSEHTRPNRYGWALTRPAWLGLEPMPDMSGMCGTVPEDLYWRLVEVDQRRLDDWWPAFWLHALRAGLSAAHPDRRDLAKSIGARHPGRKGR